MFKGISTLGEHPVLVGKVGLCLYAKALHSQSSGRTLDHATITLSMVSQNNTSL